MSYFVEIFCKSAETVTRYEIAQFVIEGIYFSDTPNFYPSLHSDEIRATEWKSFDIFYQIIKRPVQLLHDTDKTFIQQVIGETIQERIPIARKPLQQHIADHLNQTRQIFVFDFDPTSITQECWEMLAALEAYLSRKTDAIVFAAEDGIYDTDLKLICSLKSTI